MPVKHLKKERLSEPNLVRETRREPSESELVAHDHALVPVQARH